LVAAVGSIAVFIGVNPIVPYTPPYWKETWITAGIKDTCASLRRSKKMSYTGTKIRPNFHEGVFIVPSVLAADFMAMGASVQKVADAPWLHLDIMDGHFVPNITFGATMVSAFRRHTNQFLDVHLMISEPEKYVQAFAAAGASQLTVHAEVCPHLQRVLTAIKEHGMQAGVALNPSTPPQFLEWVLDDLDVILVMTVNPGFGGLKFLPKMLRKIEMIRDMLDDQKATCVLEVDGGVDTDTAATLVKSGARALVAGTAVFGAQDPQEALDNLLQVALSRSRHS
jgi:ribulose-phosphate 3-epimerase